MINYIIDVKSFHLVCKIQRRKPSINNFGSRYNHRSGWGHFRLTSIDRRNVDILTARPCHSMAAHFLSWRIMGRNWAGSAVHTPSKWRITLARPLRHKVGMYTLSTHPEYLPLSPPHTDGGLSEGYGHDGPGVCLGDGQTEPREYRRKVNAATRCSGVCPHTWSENSGDLRRRNKRF